jgi:hypothetical protein
MEPLPRDVSRPKLHFQLPEEIHRKRRQGRPTPHLSGQSKQGKQLVLELRIAAKESVQIGFASLDGG